VVFFMGGDWKENMRNIALGMVFSIIISGLIVFTAWAGSFGSSSAGSGKTMSATSSGSSGGTWGTAKEKMSSNTATEEQTKLVIQGAPETVQNFQVLNVDFSVDMYGKPQDNHGFSKGFPLYCESQNVTDSKTNEQQFTVKDTSGSTKYIDGNRAWVKLDYWEGGGYGFYYGGQPTHFDAVMVRADNFAKAGSTKYYNDEKITVFDQDDPGVPTYLVNPVSLNFYTTDSTKSTFTVPTAVFTSASLEYGASKNEQNINFGGPLSVQRKNLFTTVTLDDGTKKITNLGNLVPVQDGFEQYKQSDAVRAIDGGGNDWWVSPAQLQDYSGEMKTVIELSSVKAQTVSSGSIQEQISGFISSLHF